MEEKAQTLEQLIKQLEFNHIYLLDLVRDVREEDMAHSPSKGLENHPSFTLGHLITAYGLTTKYLGGNYTVKKEWDDIFRRNGPGDPRLPTSDKKLYPSKQALIEELNHQHNILLSHLSNVSIDKLNEHTYWRFSNYLPKTIDLLYFMCITHYAMHISQLAAWRRAMDLPSSLKRL